MARKNIRMKYKVDNEWIELSPKTEGENVGLDNSSSNNALQGKNINNTQELLNEVDDLHKSDIGLGNVDDIKQATKSEFDSHVGSSGDSHGLVTTSVHGFMSSDDKSKLDDVATNANNYSHPSTHPASMITVASSNFTAGDVEGVVDELFTSVSSGKGLIATAITDKGVSASGSDSFSLLSSKISQIPSGVMVMHSVIALEAPSVPGFEAWANIIYPNEDRGIDFISLCEEFTNSHTQINGQVPLAVRQSDQFDDFKAFTVPNYNPILPTIGGTSPVSLTLTWVELLLADYNFGNAVYDWLTGDPETEGYIYDNTYAMRAIINGDDYDNLKDYKVGLVDMPYTGLSGSVLQIMAWTELLLANYDAGQNLLDFLLNTSPSDEEVTNSYYAMKVIMEGEEIPDLVNYRNL